MANQLLIFCFLYFFDVQASAANGTLQPLFSPDPKVRGEAVLSLWAEKNPTQLFPALKTATEDSDLANRTLATQLIRDLGKTPETLELLKEMMQSSYLDSRSSALEIAKSYYLAGMKDKTRSGASEFLGLLKTGVMDGSPEIRIRAAGMLEDFLYKEAGNGIPFLPAEVKYLIQDSDPKVFEIGKRFIARVSDLDPIAKLNLKHLSMLKDADWNSFEYATGLAGNQEVDATIKRFLLSGSDNARESAAGALLGRRDPAADELFKIALADKAPTVRQAAVDALKGRTDKFANSAIEKAINDENLEVQDAAARLLGNRSDAESVPLLKLALNKPGLQSAIFDDVLPTRRDGKALIALLDSLATDSRMRDHSITEIFSNVGTDPSAQKLFEGILDQSKNDNLKKLVLWNLSDRKGPDALTLTIKGLAQNQKKEVRLAAAESLRGRSEALFQAAFETALADSDAGVRAEAAAGLWGNGPFVDSLIGKALADPSERVRVNATKEFFNRSDLSLIPLLEKALNDPSVSVRRNAARALPNFDDPAILPLVEKAFKDADQEVGVLARKAIIESANKNGPLKKALEKKISTKPNDCMDLYAKMPTN